MKKFEALKIKVSLLNLYENGVISQDAFEEITTAPTLNSVDDNKTPGGLETARRVHISEAAYQIALSHRTYEKNISIILSSLILFASNCLETVNKPAPDNAPLTADIPDNSLLIKDDDKKVRNHIAILAKKTGRLKSSIAKQAINLGLVKLDQRCETETKE